MTLNQKEQARIRVLVEVERGRMTVRDAAESINRSVRQTHRTQRVPGQRFERMVLPVCPTAIAADNQNTRLGRRNAPGWRILPGRRINTSMIVT